MTDNGKRSVSCFSRCVTIVAAVVIFAVLFRKELFLLHRKASKFPYTPKHYYWKNGPCSTDSAIADPESHGCMETGIKPFTNPFDDSTTASKRLNKIGNYAKMWLEDNKENPFNHEIFDGSILEYSNYNQDSMRSGGAYGVNFNDFYNFIDYFNKNFDQIKLNLETSVTSDLSNHYVSKVAGIDIHFIKYRINVESSGGDGGSTAATKKTKSSTQFSNEIDAILLLHGWPSSYHEFSATARKLIELINQRAKSTSKKDVERFNLDLIIPSLPGFVFSDTSTDFSYFDVSGVAMIFRELMESKYKLNYNKYIVVGSDWGSLVGHVMSYSTEIDEMDNKIRRLHSTSKKTSFEKKLKGLYITSVGATTGPLHETIFATFNISFINEWIANYDQDSINDLQKSWNSPMKNVFLKNIDMSGYQHLQGTRPDTIGIALESSPISLLAYIYEKYLSWSDTYSKYSQRANGVANKGLEYNDKHISGELTWGDVLMTGMLYWSGGSVTSTVRYYKESIFIGYSEMPNTIVPDDIYVGIGHFTGDPFSTLTFKPWIKYNYPSCIYYKRYEAGGHFAAMEYPMDYAKGILEFLDNIAIAQAERRSPPVEPKQEM